MFLCKSRREGGEYAKKEAKKLPDDDFHLIFSSEAKQNARSGAKNGKSRAKGADSAIFQAEYTQRRLQNMCVFLTQS